MKDTSFTKSSLGLLAGVLTAAFLPQASLSAQSGSFMLFGFDYDVAGFGQDFSGEDAISATQPDGGGQTGSFQLGRVDRIDSVSIELSHARFIDVTFLLTAPNGDQFSLFNGPDNLSGLGDGGSDLQGLATYEFTESTGSTLGAATGDPIPGGAYRAETWQTAPTGGWAPGTWTLLLRDSLADNPGAVGRVEVHGVPEPSAFALLAGLGALAGVALRRRPVQGRQA